MKRQVHVHYPSGTGRIVLRTENDWERDVEPVEVEGERSIFEVASPHPTLDFKPCLRDGPRFTWAEGANKLLLLTHAEPRLTFPHFYSGIRGEITPRIDRFSARLGREMRLRIYLPAGYHENHLKRYGVLYLHDGQNVFLPEEAFMGREWQVDETLDLLDSMSLIDQVIVVGVHSGQREDDYSQPGYEHYGRALVEELKPWIDKTFRTLPEPASTAVMGSSLGGVVAFYMAWEYPEVFGGAACLSPTFWYQNNLLDRVREESIESRRGLKIYLDSGWPRDNYEVTLAMANALVEAGFEYGSQLMHSAFPMARHHEDAWAARVHLPIQLFWGRLARRVQAMREDGHR